jgi:hypothetical protein
MEPYVREHKVNWHPPYDNESKLRNYLSAHFKVSDTDATLYDLGLKYDKGLLVSAEGKVPSNVVSKLMDRKLEDFELMHLRRFSLWHFIDRWLFLKHSTNEAWHVPLCVHELSENHIVAYDDSAMRPWEGLKGWCKRKHYRYIPWPYPESKLTEGT